MGAVLDPSPLLVSMLEEYTFLFSFIAILRAALGRRSVALMFRPGPCARPTTWRMWLKSIVLRMLKRKKAVRILTILPFVVDADFALVASGWVYELQLWDLCDTPREIPQEIAATLAELANGRRIVLALGGQSYEKGFAQLVRIWLEQPSIRQHWLFAVAGPVEVASRELAESFVRAGGFLVDRRLGDGELWGLYGVAELVWACYAPTYDQSSGIFGRAVQAGVPVIVRSGSYLEKLAQHLNHPVVAIPWDNTDVAAKYISRPPAGTDPAEARESSCGLRKSSIITLVDALGIDAHMDVYCVG
jgi:hypothetical protein